MRKKLSVIIPLILLMAGICVIAYPYICQMTYDHQARKVNEDYVERIKQKPENDIEWLYQLIVQYNKELYEGGQSGLADAFSYQQVDFSLIEFGLDEEMIGYLTIPKMDIELPIYLGANKENLAKGAAHLTQTSLPVGGINTNSVIAAHRGMSTAAMFRDIEKLELGDMIYITNFRETLHYRVAEVTVIKPSDIDAILIQENRDLVTLVTCHPYRHNYQRYVVYCERVTDPASEAAGEGTSRQDTGLDLGNIFRFNELTESQRNIFLERWLPVGIVVLFLIIGVIILIYRRIKGRNQETDIYS